MSVPTPSALQQKFGSAKIQAKSMSEEQVSASLKVSESKAGTSSQTKKAFVPKKHLTQRPFQNPELQALRDSLPKSKRSSTENRNESDRKSSERSSGQKRQINNRYAAVQSLKKSGMTNVAIAKKLGISESTVRRALQPPRPRVNKTTKKQENN